MSLTATLNEPVERQSRDLTGPERRVKNWIKQNHGILSRIARETGKSVQFVQRIAYNHEARSRGLVVENQLLRHGCPLIQKIR